jgi:DNA-binding transcriptional ArsR family regulator
MSQRRPARRTRQPSRALYEAIAQHFRVLGEPARLDLLHLLSDGPESASALLARTGMSQAGLSKHMTALAAAGFVRRWREGPYVHYALADDRVLALCELMCDRLETAAASTYEIVASR